MTSKQESFIRNLLDERELTQEQRDESLRRLSNLTVEQASRWIERLLTLPMKPQAKTGAKVDIPDGRYALPTPDAVNEHTFYRVWIGDRGGFRVYLQHGPESTAMSRAAGITVMQQIKEFGAEQASALYGKLIGSCGVCGRRLTNDESRERGIGPVCAGKVGW